MIELDYQSERHCSKTKSGAPCTWLELDYQSERHCSKTALIFDRLSSWLDYQSERHCSKTPQLHGVDRVSWITSQNDTAPKRRTCRTGTCPVGLPVRTTLLQNYRLQLRKRPPVGLPVRTTLLQNRFDIQRITIELDYQSERHCSKTLRFHSVNRVELDYQSERHCSKTRPSIV